MLDVCEIGVSSGQMLVFMQTAERQREKSWSHWTAVDCQLKSEVLRQNGYRDLVEADIKSTTPQLSSGCDVIILLHILEHLYDPEEALRRIVPLLRPGGIVIGGHPVTPEPFRRWRQDVLRRKAKRYGHVSVFSPRRMHDMAAKAGLDVIEKQGIDNDYTRSTRALTRVRVATEDLRDHVNSILTLARSPESTTLTEIDINEVVRSVLGDLDAAGLAMARVIWTPPDTPTIAFADPVLAKMLVRNLVHNALQHASIGNVVVEIGADGLSISDQGPGLPPTYKTLFDPDTERQDAPEGAIGLYLVTLIAEHLHWRLSVHSEAGEDTRVNVYWASK